MSERAPVADLGELIRYLTVNLVDSPDEVVVSLVEERDASVYEIEVGDDDLGKIIGRGGKTARAIRSVVSAAAPRTVKRSLEEFV